MEQSAFVNEFTLPVRVYYEDTDAGGVVYHASYVRFMERARTEWLRSLGFEQDQLLRTLKVAFAVRHLELDYLKPARFNDLLYVHASIETVGRASMVFTQQVWRENEQKDRELLVKGNVKVVSIDVEKFCSTAIPIAIRNLLP